MSIHGREHTRSIFTSEWKVLFTTVRNNTQFAHYKIAFITRIHPTHVHK
jgi:hypothetical protein